MENNSSPLYRQIANKIREHINNGEYTYGEAIPSEIKLSKKYGVSRVTVRQAIDTLVQEGLLYKVQGSGTYVKKAKIEHDIYTVQGFTEEMRRLNKEPVNKILEFKMEEPDDKIKQILHLQSGVMAFFVTRLRYVDEIPVVLEKTYLPVSLFPDLSYEIMLSSKYEYIEKKKGLKIKESFQEIIPLLPDQEIKQLLELKKDIPILKMKLWSTLDNDIVFEYTELYFNSDKYKFTLVAKR
jgi:GntR family mannosyl-D-glycerate transport/metabolism transcriptional repressor